MRARVIISKENEEYLSSVCGKYGGGHTGAFAGNTPIEAAIMACALMRIYAKWSDEGGDLIAPAEVMLLVPNHLKSVKGDGKMEKNFMNPITGSIGTKNDWDYEDIDGNTQNAVDTGEVVEVKRKEGEWVEV